MTVKEKPEMTFQPIEIIIESQEEYDSLVAHLKVVKMEHLESEFNNEKERERAYAVGTYIYRKLVMRSAG